MIYIKSVVSGHKKIFIKPRIATEKIEAYMWDPYSMCVQVKLFKWPFYYLLAFQTKFVSFKIFEV